MKIMVYKALLLFFIGLVDVQGIHAETNPERDFVKNIERTFTINPEGTVRIENKYGNVFVESNQTNRVVFEVEIIVDAASHSRADDVFKRIQIEFENSPSMVVAKTHIENKSGFSWVISKNDNYQINYYVQIPKSSTIDCYNRYGDIELSLPHWGPTKIDLRYGDIEASDITGDVKIELSYGEGKLGQLMGYTELDLSYIGLFEVEHIENGTIETAYTKFSSNRLRDVRIHSKYSKFEIDNLGKLENFGKYDHWHVKESNSISMDTEYTQVDLGELIRYLTMDNVYGKLSIGVLNEELEKVDIDAAYMPVKIENTNGTSYYLDIETSHSDVDVELDKYTDIDLEDDMFSKDLKAKKGSDPKGNIRIELKYGSIRID